ncbi:MAG: PilZ domain-containing protein [Gammaproteobacteria bacterium]|nr:PilZ domain-containing protein [Gammaproteobacteria bacterium]
MPRKYIRHPSGIPIDVVVSESPELGQKYLHDISNGGLCFDSRTRLANGRDILIRVYVRKEPVEIRGHVVWCHRSQTGYEIGVVFHGADEAYRARMVEQVCHIEQYRQQLLKTEGRELTSEEAAREWISKYAPEFPYGD